MAPTRQNLHYLVDAVDEKEVSFAFHFLTKLIPEVEPLPDEIEAIEHVQNHGEFIDIEDIDWDEYRG